MWRFRCLACPQYVVADERIAENAEHPLNSSTAIVIAVGTRGFIASLP